jgi:hypothetical protein
MYEKLDQLLPITEILGPESVSASYSDRTLGNSATGYSPGWKVEVDGTYKGAAIQFTNKAVTLDEAASTALTQLKNALGLH